MKKYPLWHFAVYTPRRRKQAGTKIDEEGAHTAFSPHVCSTLHVFLSEQKPKTIEQTEWQSEERKKNTDNAATWLEKRRIEMCNSRERRITHRKLSFDQSAGLLCYSEKENHETLLQEPAYHYANNSLAPSVACEKGGRKRRHWRKKVLSKERTEILGRQERWCEKFGP